jgi:hypothetical protein
MLVGRRRFLTPTRSVWTTERHARESGALRQRDGMVVNTETAWDVLSDASMRCSLGIAL